MDVPDVLRILLGITPDQDKLIWHYDELGQYTIKMGYRLVFCGHLTFLERDDDILECDLETQGPTESQSVHLAIALRCLPTFDSLSRKRVRCLHSCHVCGAFESILHVFCALVFEKCGTQPLSDSWYTSGTKV